MAGEMPAAAVTAAAAEARALARAGDGGADGAAGWARAAATAIEAAEAFTGLRLIERDAVERVVAAGGSGAWRMLAGQPATAITAARLVAADGTGTDLAPAAWAADLDADGRGWVRVTGLVGADRVGAAGYVVIRYRAGLAAEWASVPAPIRHGVAALAAHLMGARGDDPPPAAVAALWRPFRRLGLADACRGPRT